VPVGPESRVLASPNEHEDEASITGHLNLTGYDPLIVDSYAKLMALGDEKDPLNPVNTLLGLKYLLRKEPFDNADYELIGINYGHFYYRKRNPFPRTWIAQNIVVEPNDDAIRAWIKSANEETLHTTVYVDQPINCSGQGGTAAITDYKANTVTLETSGDGGMLILSDQYYPGWQVTIDGQQADLIRTDTVLRGVCISSGQHQVRFEYRPTSLLIGAVISAVGWILVAVTWILTRRS
jgi:hypothetical protein